MTSFQLRILIAVASGLLGTLPAWAAANVLLVAGEPSHGPGEHRFPAGCELLAETLNTAGLPLRAEVSEGWPNESALLAANALVLYSDGLDRHVAFDRVAELRRHAVAGKGLAVLHFALEPAPGELADFLIETVGGCFEVDWSVNPVWTVSDPILAEHPATRGVKAFTLDDEWYYHLRFHPDAKPILQALPPESSLGADGPRSGNPAVRAALARRERQTLAWVFENRSGGRGFGFTGGHFHRNWAQDDFRRLVLNAIVWTARVDVPDTGVASTVAAIPRYATIDEAIARNDIADVRLHLSATPASLHRGANESLTPLHQAILRNRSEIAVVLLEAGADPNVADGSRRTPLHLAVIRGNAPLVDALLANRAEPNRLDQLGWTPLHHAAARDHMAIARALLAGGADPHQRSELGGTPLHEAAASGSGEMVHLLLAAGVDPTVVSQTGVTALDIARERGNEPAIAALAAP